MNANPDSAASPDTASADVTALIAAALRRDAVNIEGGIAQRLLDAVAARYLRRGRCGSSASLRRSR